MSWKAFGDRVIVKKIKNNTQTDSGIYLAEALVTELDKVARAEVVSVGTGKKADGTVEPIPVNVGDVILYHKHYGTDLSGLIETDDDRDLMVLSSEDILGIVPG